ncbi:glycyl-radical enzyme activating protein [Lacrimispora sp.]|uniref:glycyl-radical enzyme activating protein n=1 Tax=Lacrimispora sp. TaxID=2719234 RepID=UPI00289B82E6|nr:glycyl-radical enzyme activating protein [Lacrimispora sp.]
MERQGFISTIQKYSTKDGPGIRSTVFFMGCNLRCKWCSNPELLENRVRLMHFSERCIHCGACVEIAANKSIRFAARGCVIDREKCTNAAACADICPKSAYELVGHYITVSDLTEQLVRDEVFYRKSGGGVTFSGGEAALQGLFVAETAERLKANGIHTALDTAGALPWKAIEPVVRAVDMLLYDIKAIDPAMHMSCTGADNKYILENAIKAAELDKDMIIRLVIVPGLNDALTDVKERIDFIKSLGSNVKRVDILNYHTLGKGKYHRLGMMYPIAGEQQCGKAFLEEVKQYALTKGLNACLEV